MFHAFALARPDSQLESRLTPTAFSSTLLAACTADTCSSVGVLLYVPARMALGIPAHALRVSMHTLPGLDCWSRMRVFKSVELVYNRLLFVLTGIMGTFWRLAWPTGPART